LFTDYGLRMNTMMTSLIIGSGNPYHFILPATHPTYTRWMEEIEAGNDLPEPLAKRQKEEWPSKHLEAYRAIDMQWPPQYGSEPFTSRSEHLTPRAREVAWFIQSKHARADPVGAEYVAFSDLTHSLDWFNESGRSRTKKKLDPASSCPVLHQVRPLGFPHSPRMYVGRHTADIH
jgi:hypothetical protein